MNASRNRRSALPRLFGVVFALWAAIALAQPEPFPPRKPSPMPAFTIPAATNSLDEEWVFVDTLYDASRSRPDLFSAYPVSLEFTHGGRGYLVMLHTVYRTTDAGEVWMNMDLFPPPAANTTWQSVRPPAYISHGFLRPAVNTGIGGDSLYLAVVNGDGENGFVRLILNVGESMTLSPFAQFTTDNWITHVAAPRNDVTLAFAGLDGLIFRFAPDTTITVDTIPLDTLGNDTIIFDTSIVRVWDTLDYNFFGTWVDDAEVVDERVIAAGSDHLTGEDLGTTWSALPPADAAGVRDLDFAPDGLHGLACGRTEGGGGWARRTIDGGETWSERTLTTIFELRQAHMLTAEIGFACGGNVDFPDGRIYRTDDGGLTWQLELLANAEIRVINSVRASGAYVNVIAAGVFPDFSAGVWRSRVFLPDSAGPVLYGDPDPLVFGDVLPGEADTLELTVHNIGDEAAFVFNVTSSNGAFDAIWSVAVEVPPNTSVNVPIEFAPESAGTYSATLMVQNSTEDDVRIPVRGTSGIVALDPAEPALPKEISLKVWPNPGNAEFRFGYELDHAQNISLSVYDLTGRLVTVVERGNREPGRYVASWNAAAQASGLYFARLETSGGVVKLRKVMLVK